MTPIIVRDWRKGGEVHPAATLVRPSELRDFLAVTSEEGVEHRLKVLDSLGLIIRPTKGRRTVQYRASKLDKQERFVAFCGYPGDVLSALRDERERRREAGERRDDPVPDAGNILRSERTGRPLILRW